MKQVLIETQTFTASPVTLTEGKSENGNLLVKGILATAEVKNGNGRYYSKELWEREIDKYMESVRANRALGELDHPDSSIINLKNVSHNIKKIFWEGDNVMGIIELLPTPSGNILTSLFKNNIPVGVSSEPLHENNGDDELVEVQDDFEFLTLADCVSDPSTHNADMILHENKNNINKRVDSKIDLLIHDILCELNNNCCLK